MRRAPSNSTALMAGLLAVALGCRATPAAHGGDGAGNDAASDGRSMAPPPAVVLLIGDGMGPGQIEAASLYRHGVRDGLVMQQLARTAPLRTGSPSGITDSAAGATVMATGTYTYNGRIGIDRQGQPVETLIERAAARGWSTGVVTTTALPHATPAAFTSHVSSRGQLVDIAAQMVRGAHPDVMLGGGALYFAPMGAGSARTDGGLHGDLALAGYTHVTTAADLATAVALGAPRLFGAFAPDHLTFVAARASDTTEPMLVDMAAAALATLERDPHGLFLMIEGGRIDHGGHANSLVDVVQEALAFDDAVAHVLKWARLRGNATVMVTADHETGGLEVVEARPAGEYPPVRWRWGNHTNARVSLFAEGPGTEIVDGAVLDHRWVHAIAQARLDNGTMVVPPREPIPNGELGDLRHLVASQTTSTDFGAGLNQLEALWLDATADGLFIGIEGLFGWEGSAVEVLIDVDPLAASTAPLAGHVSDQTGVADQVLAASTLGAPQSPFGADFVLVAVGGADPKLEELRDDGGLRALGPPSGQPSELGWLPAAINFGAVRTRTAPMEPVAGQGLEAFIPWGSLYPAGMIPVGARLRLAAVLVNASGDTVSNQFLPPLPPTATTAGAGAIPVRLPGVVEYMLDADNDGQVDGDLPPIVLP